MAKRGGGCGVTGLLMFLILIVVILIGVVGFLYLKDNWVANRHMQLDNKKIKTALEKGKSIYKEDFVPYGKKIEGAVKEKASALPVTNWKRKLKEKAIGMLSSKETNEQLPPDKPLVKQAPVKKKPVAKVPVKKEVVKKIVYVTNTKVLAKNNAAKKSTQAKPLPIEKKSPEIKKSATVKKNRTVKVYLTKYLESEGAFTLVPVSRSAEASDSPLEDTLKTLLRGTTDDEDSQNYSTSIPGGVILLRVVVKDGIATIDYNRNIESGAGKALMESRIYQIIYTATEFETVKKVQILVDGKALSNFAGQGIDLSQPVGRLGLSPRFKDQ